MVKTAKTSITTKKHEDRVQAAKTSFDCTSVDVLTPQTMIILLASREDMVLMKALSTLDKYASKFEQNASVLYEEGILNPLVPLVNHTELIIKRFAVKLLSELCFLPPVAEVLLEKKYVQPLMEILGSSEDLVVQEFSSSLLAELTKSIQGLSQIVDSKLTHILPGLLTSSDPDVQKNCLQILCNVIKDPYDYQALTPKTIINVKDLINLLMSEFPIIQNLTLDLLNILTQSKKNNTFPKEFQDSAGVTKLMSILKNLEWKDLHEKCLGIIGNIYEDGTVAQNFLKDEVLQLFSYMEIINDPQLKKAAVEVIARVANTALGRKALSNSGHVATLVGMIQEQNIGLTEAVCHCVSALAQDYSALQQMVANDIVTSLLEVLADPLHDANTRTAAVNAMYQILLRDQDSCQVVANSGKLDVFSSILKEYNKDISIVAPLTALNCIKTLVDKPELRQQIITPNLMKSMLHCFKEFPEDTIPLKVAACETLNSLIGEPRARTYLRFLDGLPVVWVSVTKHKNNLPLLTSAATFIHQCVTNDIQFATELLKLNAINWLLSQRGLRDECPAWEVALETFLNKFLPLKFAFTGRLKLTDVTENNFYITRLPLSREELQSNMFPLLTELISKHVCPSKMLYVASFDEIESTKGSEERMGSEFEEMMRRRTEETRKGTIESLRRGTGETTRRGSTLSKKKESRKSINTILSDNRNLSFSDPYLQKYLDTLKSLLNKNGFTAEDVSWKNNVMDSNTVQRKVLLIGQFVADQMAGMDPTEKCTIHTLDLHINEIKVEIEDNIIPLGSMRVGLHMERALLFKVLADRVGLPASLVRGSRGRRGWIEVALPELPPEPRPAYPNHLLRPNYVLNLMVTPVTLHPLGSYEADVYCGLMENVL